MLLHGPPGTGKTTLARECAHDAGVKLFSVNGPEIISQYDGETEQALHEVFDNASKASPSVVSLFPPFFLLKYLFEVLLLFTFHGWKASF